MNRPRWRITDLLLLTAAAGLLFAIFRTFWWQKTIWYGYPNYRIIFAFYLASLAIGIVTAFWGRNTIRRFCAGYAVYGCLHVVFILRGGFYHLSSSEDFFSYHVILGVMLGSVCGIATNWLMRRNEVKS